VAERLGVSRTAVGNWERGESVPNAENLSRLAKLYGKTESALLHGLVTPTLGEHPSGMSTKLTVWLYHFLAELAGAGATQEELKAAQDLLLAPQLRGFQYGGDHRAPGEVSEEDLRKTMSAIMDAIREILREKGRKV
jgi:transcriptional regulator with XRE-family HTH domain